MYIFRGTRRYENLYPPEEQVARRVKHSPTSWQTYVTATRLLTDGETTLMDTIDVGADGKTVLHSPNLRAGAQQFFRLAEGVPLQLGNPDPPEYDLGKCLGNVLAGRGKAVLAELDEAARLDGTAVVKIMVDVLVQDVKLRVTFWVDLEHGAIPVQSRVVGTPPHTGIPTVLQFNNTDVRWAGRGWLPFRWSVAQGDLSPDGDVPTMFVREVVIDDADFAKKPDRALFSMDFPKEYGLSDSDRLVGFGSRRVWSLNDFSPAARALAHPIRAGVGGSLPGMPNARSPWTSWALSLILLGITLLLGAGTLVFRRALRHV